MIKEYTIGERHYFVEKVLAVCMEAGDVDGQPALLVQDIDEDGNRDEYVIFSQVFPEDDAELAEWLADGEMISTYQDTLETVRGATYNR